MKTVVLMLIFGLILATNAFALTGGFTFSDNNIINLQNDSTSGSWTWTHTLQNTDFKPLLIGDIDEITSAKLALNFTFTPAQAGNSTNYQLHLKTDLDDIVLGTYNDAFYDSGEKTRDWEIIIGKKNALIAISDKSAEIVLSAQTGEIYRVNSSTLSGTGIGNVAPEPVSMVFVGVGFVSLPFLRKMRGKIKSTHHRC